VTQNPSEFLPLTDLAFSMLVALADEELHGYALVMELRRRTGRDALRTGTVYAALARLRDDGLVTETRGSAATAGADPRRRYYALTPLGRSVARAEADRLEELLDLARAKRLTPDTA
jgi:DNA-binding PadR family transcriptional regulator